MRTFTFLFLLSCLGGCLFLPANLKAQQLPNFVSQFQQPGIYNPARLHDGTISALYRRQWLDLPSEEAPVSYFVHADLSGLLQLGEKRIGLGLQFIGDQAFVINSNRIGLNFAYHLIDEEDRRLSAGIQAGYLSQSLDFGEARVNNPFDLELLTGSFSGGSFDGGPGVHYSQKFAGGAQLEIDLSALQLYSDRVDLENGSSFDLQRHLMARVAVRFPVGESAALEPIIQFRQGIDEFALKSDQLDLGLRAHFLDRVTVALGTRLAKEVSVFNLSFAVDVGGPVGVIAAYETNPIFGGTYEAGLYLNTIVEDSPPGPPRPQEPEVETRPDRTRPDRTRPERVNVRTFKQEFDGAVAQAESAMEVTDQGLNNATTRINQVANNTVERDNFFQQAEIQLNDLNRSLTRTREAIDQANRTYLEAGTALGDQAAGNRTYQRMGDELTPLSMRLATQTDSYTALTERLNSFRNNLAEDVSNRDVVAISNYFQQRIDAMINDLPLDLETVQVRQAAVGGIEVDFAFPRGQRQFDLNDPELEDIRLLIQFVGGEAIKAQRDGLVLSSIELKAELSDSEEDLRLFSNAGSYVSEFGTTAYSFRYDFRNPRTNELQNRRAIIQAGEVDLVELTALKLEAMRRELTNIGVDASLIKLELVSPVEQSVPERYLIRVVLRP